MDAPYLGDYAGVLPDDNANLMHLNDQFTNIEEKYQMQQAAQAKADQARRFRLSKYLGDTLSPKNTLSGTVEDPAISTAVKNSLDKNTQDILNGVDESTIMGNIQHDANGISQYSSAAKQGNANITKSVAAIIKLHPEIDHGALTDLAATKMFYNVDKNGNKTLKDPSTINPNEDVVSSVIDEHPDKIFPGVDPATGIGPGLTNMLTKEKSQDVGDADVYDANGNRTTVGYKGKIPTDIAGYSTDTNGNIIKDAKGLPVVEAKHMNYQLPGTGTDYIDPTTKQPVKVATPEVYAKYMTNPAVSGPVENRVQNQLSAMNDQLKAQGKPPLDPNGPIADMLRKKTVYDQLNSQIQGSYSLIPNADKTFEYKQQLAREKMEQERIGILRSNNSLAWIKHNDAKGVDPSTLPYLTDGIVTKSGVDITPTTIDGTAVPAGTPPMKFVEGKNIDPGDMQFLNGKSQEKDFEGKPVENVEFSNVTMPDGSTKQGYFVKDNGDLAGKGGQIIDRNAVQARVIHTLKPEEIKLKTPVTIRGTINKAIAKVKGAFTSSGLPIIK